MEQSEIHQELRGERGVRARGGFRRESRLHPPYNKRSAHAVN